MSEPCPDSEPDALAASRAERIAALYDQFGTRLYRTAWGMLGREQDAEDAVHEVFVSLVRSRVKFEEVEDMAAYLFTALRRSAGKLAQRRAKEPAVSNDTVQQATARSHDTETFVAASEWLERALQSLPAEQREVIALKIDGYFTPWFDS